MTNDAAMLEDYIDADKKPAQELFKALRTFNPCQLPVLSMTLADFHAIQTS